MANIVEIWTAGLFGKRSSNFSFIFVRVVKEETESAMHHREDQNDETEMGGTGRKSEEEGILRRVRNEKIPGRRARGRPKLRWSNVVELDMEERGRTYTDAQDRSEWRRRIQTADPR